MQLYRTNVFFTRLETSKYTMRNPENTKVNVAPLPIEPDVAVASMIFVNTSAFTANWIAANMLTAMPSPYQTVISRGTAAFLRRN